jgi:hypothetical protein
MVKIAFAISIATFATELFTTKISTRVGSVGSNSRICSGCAENEIQAEHQSP